MISFAELFGVSTKVRAYMAVRWLAYDSGYHLHIESAARRHGLLGWLRVVRTPMDNFMQFEAEGSKHSMEKFLNTVRQAPAAAKALGADVQWKTYKGEFHGFRVRS